ncbi:LOV domain-containing protein, putative [Babesia caballi]|uniref:LOV domain-containing protein, putative n=1 Tax=Babesia caballi TaxID=5871 RepID=A0AAV4LQF2_BABCB|nr:LOV domain-containing protein, putative [Babesia caballi]
MRPPSGCGAALGGDSAGTSEVPDSLWSILFAFWFESVVGGASASDLFVVALSMGPWPTGSCCWSKPLSGVSDSLWSAGPPGATESSEPVSLADGGACFGLGCRPFVGDQEVVVFEGRGPLTRELQVRGDREPLVVARHQLARLVLLPHLHDDGVPHVVGVVAVRLQRSRDAAQVAHVPVPHQGGVGEVVVGVDLDQARRVDPNVLGVVENQQEVAVVGEDAAERLEAVVRLGPAEDAAPEEAAGGVEDLQRSVRMCPGAHCEQVELVELRGPAQKLVDAGPQLVVVHEVAPVLLVQRPRDQNRALQVRFVAQRVPLVVELQLVALRRAVHVDDGDVHVVGCLGARGVDECVVEV